MRKYLLLLLMLFVIPFVSADIFDDFDSYPIGAGTPATPFWNFVDDWNQSSMISTPLGISGNVSWELSGDDGNSQRKAYFNRSKDSDGVNNDFRFSVYTYQDGGSQSDLWIVGTSNANFNNDWVFGQPHAIRWVMQSGGQWYRYCNNTWAPSAGAGWSIDTWYNVTIVVDESANEWEAYIDGVKRDGCVFDNSITQIDTIGFTHGNSQPVITDNLFITGISVPVFTIDWDSESPLNGETRADDPLSFDYTLTNVDGTANCTLYSNKTGTFNSAEQTFTGLTDGSHQLDYNPAVNETRDLQFKINCTDDSDNVETSTKTIEIDTKNVVITYLNPASDGSDEYNENVGNVQINIRYSNHNLDYVNYSVIKPDGTVAQSNFNDTFIDPLNYEFDELVSVATNEVGLWTVNAYGNDTQGLQTSLSTTFTILDNSMVLDWDSDVPTNGSTIIDQTSVAFDYTLTLNNITSTDCNIYKNDVLENSETHTTSGTKSFIVSYPEETDDTASYKVNCTSLGGYIEQETSIKTITVFNDIVQTLRLMTLVPLLIMIVAFVLIWKNRKSLLSLN